MCVYAIYLYFYYRWRRAALCRCRFWFIRDGCSPVVKPRPSPFCYMDWWESHHCQRPIFFPQQFAFKSPPCHSCGHCTFVVNIRKVSCSDCLSGLNLQIHLLRWVTVQSSQSNPGWEGLQEMCGPSSCSEQALSSDQVAQDWKSLPYTTLVQMNAKALCVLFSPHVFLAKKSNSAIPSKNNYSPTSSLSSLLSVLGNKMAGCPEVFNLWVPPEQSLSRWKAVREPRATLYKGLVTVFVSGLSRLLIMI